jgi:hypothetical protein
MGASSESIADRRIENKNNSKHYNIKEKTVAELDRICYLKWIFYHTRRRCCLPVLSRKVGGRLDGGGGKTT